MEKVPFLDTMVILEEDTNGYSSVPVPRQLPPEPLHQVDPL